MWTATIDFTKAFDSITHKSIWKALESCGIKHDYISLLKKIYKNQKASVQTDADSNSSAGKEKKRMGIYLSDHQHDCREPEVCRRRASVRNLLFDFKKSTEKVGLRIHPDKTKILGNQSSLSSDTKKELEVDDIKIEILTRGESVRYLGQTITFRQQETTEIKNRIRAAWATFHKYRQELTSKNYVLKHRLRLFDAAITPTICYAS